MTCTNLAVQKAVDTNCLIWVNSLDIWTEAFLGAGKKSQNLKQTVRKSSIPLGRTKSSKIAKVLRKYSKLPIANLSHCGKSSLLFGKLRSLCPA